MRGRGRQRRAIEGAFGAPVIGGQFNTTDVGRLDPDWYSRPAWERTEIMRQAKEFQDRADEERAIRERQDEARRLAAVAASTQPARRNIEGPSPADQPGYVEEVG